MLKTISHRLRGDRRRGRDADAVVKTRVRVRGGYEPETVYACAGKPVAIVFRREETAPCSERVIFPALGKSAMLPAYEDVTVDLTPPGPGEYEFTCQLGILRGRLVVEEPR
jgi:plastocyanin domain-containing protein